MGLSKHLTLFLLALTFLGPKAFGLPVGRISTCENRNNILRTIASDGASIQVAAGPRLEDPRKKISDIKNDNELVSFWPKASAKALNSVQTLVCGDISASAVLACDGKTIVTNAHNLRNYQRGHQLRWNVDDNKECFFAVERPDGKYLIYDIEIPTDENAKKIMGTVYPGTVGQEGKDWAVLKLKEKVDPAYAKPAMVMTPTNERELIGHPLIQTSAFNNDFGDPNSPPRIYNVMTVAEVRSGNDANYLITNGRAEGGGSGGGIFPIEKNIPYLAAISNAKFDAGDEAKVSGKGSYAIPLNGKFLETLKEQTSNKNCVKEFKSKEPRQAAI